jgi:hypothetical protein
MSTDKVSALRRPAAPAWVVVLALAVLLAAPRATLPAGGAADLADLNVALNTGVDEAGKALPAGEPDDDWREIGGGFPGDPANIILRPVPAWPPAMAGSAWISVEAQRGRTRLRTLRFERCFCLGPEAKAADIQIQLRADDLATVFLNHAPIGGPGGSFRAPAPLALSFRGAVGKGGPFRVGINCLQVEVDDSGRAVTGLDLVGSVRAARGMCAPEVLPEME